jgi:hypothetical protein
MIQTLNFWHKGQVVRYSVNLDDDLTMREIIQKHRQEPCVINGNKVRFNWLGINEYRRNLPKCFLMQLLLLGEELPSNQGVTP